MNECLTILKFEPNANEILEYKRDFFSTNQEMPLEKVTLTGIGCCFVKCHMKTILAWLVHFVLYVRKDIEYDYEKNAKLQKNIL